MRRQACCLLCSLVILLPLSSLVSHSAAAKDAKPSGAIEKKAPAAKDAKKDAGKEAPKEAAKKEPAKEAPAKPADEAKPATEKVKKGPFRIDVKLEGVFEAQNMIELCIRPEEWSGLSVLKAVEHGAMVKRGDLVLALDLEKIDLAIADQDRDLQLAALSLKDAEETLRALEKSAPLDMEAADRANRVAQEDLKQFSDVEYPLSLKTAAMVLEVAKDTVEYEEEELRQLEKMYKADEATKETEQIVLKRARDTVKRAKFILERTKAEADEFLKLVLPRHGDKIKEAAKRADIDLSRAKITLPIALTKQRLEFEKLKVQHEQAEKHLRKLREDRTLMTVKAPADGVIYYGKCSHGKWSGAGSETLHRGNSISPGEVFMTLVQTRPLLVHVSVPESDIQYVRARLAGRGRAQRTERPAAAGHRPARRRHPHEFGQFRRPAYRGPGRPGRCRHARHELRGEDGSLQEAGRPDGLAQGGLPRRPRRPAPLCLRGRQERQGQGGKTRRDHRQAKRQAGRDPQRTQGG